MPTSSGSMRGAVRSRASTPRHAPAVRRCHRVVPGGPAHAGRRARCHGGVAQHRAARGLGRRRAGRSGCARRRRRPPRRIAARAARAVCETAIQVHGGIGNTWDCLAHVFLRRALLSAEVFGGVGASLERVLSAQMARPACPRRRRWTSLTPPRSATSVSACGVAAGEQPGPAALVDGRTSTGRGRRRGTRRFTTPASSVSRGPPRSGGRTCPACTTSSSTRS